MWVVVALVGNTPPEPVSPGPYSGVVRMDTDVYDGRYGGWALATTDLGRLLIGTDEHASRGDRLQVTGTVTSETGVAAGRPYAGVLEIDTVASRESSSFWPHRAGKTVRETVMSRLQPFDDGRGLLAGFLIGDVSHVSNTDVVAMRRSGLAHFVAVSGSNVALFLALLAVVAGPLAIGPRSRALIGLLGLPVYAAATAFEPSVMRATVMAAVTLGGRLVGIVLDAWQLLSLAVASLVLYDPALTANVGFQLSVAATAGVLIGARWPARGLIWRSLAVTLGAQIAVAPLLMAHFGAVPLLSPLVNLVAAPLVAGATVLAALGVAGLAPLLGPAEWLANLVLSLARGAAPWPQLGALELGLALITVVALTVFRALRPMAALVTAVAAVALLVTGGGSLASGSVAVLDVGQGDSILINGGDGHFALVDGGPDGAVLAERLTHYGVDSIDLVIVSHVHADHVTGLAELVGTIPIGELWADPDPHMTPAFDDLRQAAGVAGLAVTNPQAGDTRRLGVLSLEVEGPMRRYASPNDQSIVVTVHGSARTMLLSGDIETYAQADLSELHADVLKVPHQGAATSDPAWLESVGAKLAVISVGPNDYGHPADWVIETLSRSGAEVRRTDVDGDVIVDLTAS